MGCDSQKRIYCISAIFSKNIIFVSIFTVHSSTIYIIKI